MAPGSIEQQARCLHVSRSADQPGACTCLEHHQVQRVVTDVGDCCDVVDGHAQDDVLAITPDQLNVVRRQAHHGVLLRRQLTSQLVGLLEGRSGTPRDPGLRSQSWRFWVIRFWHLKDSCLELGKPLNYCNHQHISWTF